MKEVAPGIFMITETENGRFVKFSVNLYVIAGSDGLIFDAGYGRKKTIRFLISEIENIEKSMAARDEICHINRVLPSHGHWDHFSGIARLREKTGIRVLATAKMLHSMGSKKKYRHSFRRETEIINIPASRLKRLWYKISSTIVDEIYLRTFGVNFISEPVEIIKENSTITTGNRTWEVIHLPGHCDDDIVLYDRKEGILLAGDIILRTITSWIGPPRSDLKAYIKSLEYLLTLPELKLILPAHGSPVIDPQSRIKEAIEHRNKRTEEILNLISESGNAGISFQQIFKTFYPGIKFHEKFIARGWILTTLQYLIDDQVITSTVAGNRKLFSLAV